MISVNTRETTIDSPVRRLKAWVEVYKASTLIHTFKHTDRLKSFTVDRIGEESKFFGFGVCQKLNIKLRDVNRELSLTTENSIKVYVAVDNSNYIDLFPTFKISEVHRDENTNELSVTAYDGLYQAASRTFAELNLTAPYTIYDVAIACRKLLSFSGCGYNPSAAVWETTYESGANFEGTENIREVLNAIAEATQTIYFVSSKNNLRFERLDRDGEPVYTIDKSKYFELDSKTNRRLSTIVHATELGDNVSASLDASGTTQYIRDNPFWDLRENINTLVNNALSAIGGITINQFDCSWRGNYLLEIGDKIALVTKDNETVYSYLLVDTIEYSGGMSQRTQWKYEDNEEETESNPSSLGDVVKQTYAKVDKANKRIDLVVSQNEANAQSIAALQLNTNSINASVEQIQEQTSAALEEVNENISTLTSRVDAAITAEDVTIQISSALENGVDKVTTSTGFTFNEEGLSVSKSGSEMKTTITEDGMTVYRESEAVLIADNEGVKAEDLHATTYLIIGTNSRFEDYGSRTGCFWIGN